MYSLKIIFVHIRTMLNQKIRQNLILYTNLDCGVNGSFQHQPFCQIQTNLLCQKSIFIKSAASLHQFLILPQVNIQYQGDAFQAAFLPVLPDKGIGKPQSAALPNLREMPGALSYFLLQLS